MLNQVMLVGRIKEILPDKLVVAIPKFYDRPYGGMRESKEVIAEVTVRISSSIYHDIVENCKVGYVVCVGGHFETEGTNSIVNADKLKLLSTRPYTEGGDNHEEEDRQN